jgi:hypothetical protein
LYHTVNERSSSLGFKRPHKSTSIFHIPKWARELGGERGMRVGNQNGDNYQTHQEIVANSQPAKIISHIQVLVILLFFQPHP